MNKGLRRAQIDLSGLESYTYFYTCLNWSPKEISLYVGPLPPQEDEQLRTDSSSEYIAQVRRDPTGNLLIIGDKGIEVGHYWMKTEEDGTLEPRSKEIFDFTVNKCQIC